MKTDKKKIGIIIYANPDHYPPVINAIHILLKEFDLMVICRNQGKPEVDYPKKLKLYRLGKLKTSRGKETQGLVMKVWEYALFSVYTVFYLRFYSCQLIYTYDMHGFIAGLLGSRLGKKIPLIYHNFDLAGLSKQKGLSYIINRLELRFARYANKIVFPDINRARLFLKEAKLAKLPHIVMNTPLRITQLPDNKLREILEAKGFNADTKVILYQGAVNVGHALLEIMRSMVFWPKNTILLLIGYIDEDFMRNFYKEAEALNLIKHIIHLPFVPYPEFFCYSIGAYIGLALYKPLNINQLFNAGASNKIFEYISLGIPVITNESPYFREVLTPEIAYFSRPDSVEDIAHTINSVFSNPKEYQNKCNAARQLHLTKYNYELQFNSIVEYIHRISDNNI